MQTLSGMPTCSAKEAEQTTQILYSDDILGDYKIISLLGKGGMGEVYLVESIQMQKQYALKILLPSLSEDTVIVKRFKTEARIMADLEHQNIVKVHFIGEDKGLIFLVMDFIDNTIKKSELTYLQAAQVANDICSGLEYAHSKGVIHRDLKVDNILIDKNGKALVSDFGIAHLANNELGLTKDNSSLGTYDYMAPEQKEGEKGSFQSDIYSLGLIFYYILTGKQASIQMDLPSKFGVNKKWDKIILKCLKNNPKDRYDSVAKLKNDILSIKPQKTNIFLISAICAILIIFLIIAGFFIVTYIFLNSDRSGVAIKKINIPPPPPYTVVAEEKFIAEPIIQKSEPVEEPAPAILEKQIIVIEKKKEKSEIKSLNYKLAFLDMNFIFIKKNSFNMGSEKGSDDEKPMHKVFLTNDYYLSEYEVSIEQYMQYLKNTGDFSDIDLNAKSKPITKDLNLSNSIFSANKKQPMLEISWFGAMKYCKWLTEYEQKAGRLDNKMEYRLPTEAEWEYAASCAVHKNFWYKSNSESRTHIVGSKQPNKLGLYDMQGNVWEWCLDKCDWKNGVKTYNYYDNIENPVGKKGIYRIRRGGGWSSYSTRCTSSNRGYSKPLETKNFIGFRICKGIVID